MDVIVTPESTTTMSVTFKAPPSGSPVTSFKATVKGGSQTCDVLVSVSPLKCTLTGLTAGTSYRITVAALVSATEIDNAEVIGFTLPDCKLFVTCPVAIIH